MRGKAMGFSDAVAEALGKYAAFQGRSRRSEYWWFLLFFVGTVFIGSTLDGFVGFPLFAPLAGLALVLPLYAAGARRLHDRGLTGWLILLPPAGGLLLGAAQAAGVATGAAAAVAGLMWLAVVALLALPGTPGPNRFGEDPKAAPVTAPPAGTAAGNSPS